MTALLIANFILTNSIVQASAICTSRLAETDTSTTTNHEIFLLQERADSPLEWSWQIKSDENRHYSVLRAPGQREVLPSYSNDAGESWSTDPYTCKPTQDFKSIHARFNKIKPKMSKEDEA